MMEIGCDGRGYSRAGDYQLDGHELPGSASCGGRRFATLDRHPMKLLISHPELAPALASALNEADCVATHIETDTLEVLVPWHLDGGNRAQTATELLFFVKAWASKHPAFRATLIEAS